MLNFYSALQDYVIEVGMTTLFKYDLIGFFPLINFHDADIDETLSNFWRVLHEKSKFWYVTFVAIQCRMQLLIIEAPDYKLLK